MILKALIAKKSSLWAFIPYKWVILVYVPAQTKAYCKCRAVSRFVGATREVSDRE